MGLAVTTLAMAMLAGMWKLAATHGGIEVELQAIEKRLDRIEGKLDFLRPR